MIEASDRNAYIDINNNSFIGLIPRYNAGIYIFSFFFSILKN